VTEDSTTYDSSTEDAENQTYSLLPYSPLPYPVFDVNDSEETEPENVAVANVPYAVPVYTNSQDIPFHRAYATTPSPVVPEINLPDSDSETELDNPVIRRLLCKRVAERIKRSADSIAVRRRQMETLREQAYINSSTLGDTQHITTLHRSRSFYLPNLL
jgi:hypothetical protein